jgi:hypothetical protein
MEETHRVKKFPKIFLIFLLNLLDKLFFMVYNMLSKSHRRPQNRIGKRKEKMTQVNRDIAREMLEKMSAEKRNALTNACRRNALLTSFWGLENATLTVYKEGWYLELDGCRAHFAIWCSDNDGELVQGRKPAEKNLNKIYSQWDKTDMIVDLEKIA